MYEQMGRASLAEGGLISRRPSLPRKFFTITVELQMVQTATAHQASTHNTERQEEYMVLAMLAYDLCEEVMAK